MSDNITGHTRLTCLLGSPVSHSISPAMHNEAFRLLNLDYVYLAFPADTKTLASTVDTLKNINAVGFNLTMPNKNEMCHLCDTLSDASKISQSVNTVVIDNGRLSGYTTDGIGFMRACRESGHPLPGKKITILGAGGAAASIFVQAALDNVAEISIFNRRSSSFTQAENIISRLKKYSSCKIRLFDYDDKTVLKREIAESAMLINAANVGMSPHTDECLIPDDSYFHKDLAVTDIIYNPQETRLLSMAKAFGCPIFNGLSMLLYQGAEAFRLFTGKEMPIAPIRQKYFSE